MDQLIVNFEEKIKEVQTVIESNDEWKKRFKEYADEMINNEEMLQELSNNFREWFPLTFYLTIGEAKTKNKRLKISVRYQGQTVADIISSNKGVYISTAKYNKSNKNFGCQIELDGRKDEWKGKNAKEFRAYFRNNLPPKQKNHEHRIESMLISEFSKDSSKDKKMCGIQPIRFVGYRIPMVTAISSSKIDSHSHSNIIKYGNGHIDILARVKGNHIVVFELKDENKSGESVENLLQQATGYAVFLLNLLQSDSGNKWYKILGFNSEVPTNPEKLTIKVCSAMPKKSNGEYTTFNTFKKECKNSKGELIGNLEYHWLYFEEDGKNITDIQSSLKK